MISTTEKYEIIKKKLLTLHECIVGMYLFDSSSVNSILWTQTLSFCRFPFSLSFTHINTGLRQRLCIQTKLLSIWLFARKLFSDSRFDSSCVSFVVCVCVSYNFVVFFFFCFFFSLVYFYYILNYFIRNEFCIGATNRFFPFFCLLRCCCCLVHQAYGVPFSLSSSHCRYHFLIVMFVCLTEWKFLANTFSVSNWRINAPNKIDGIQINLKPEENKEKNIVKWGKSEMEIAIKLFYHEFLGKWGDNALKQRMIG